MRSVRTMPYKITGVRSLADLLDCMRFDKMRFPETHGSDWHVTFLRLAIGVMDDYPGVRQDLVPSEGLTIELARDEPSTWRPTTGLWRSYGMDIAPLAKWRECPEIA